MNLNDLLIGKGIDPKQVLVLRHRPKESKLNKALPWLAAERPELFNAYQQTQKDKVERVMQKVKYVASFIGRQPGRALFIGLYAVNGWDTMTYQECLQHPSTIELMQFGLGGFESENDRPAILWFDLVLSRTFYPEWMGKLIVSWPPPERSWWRRAHKNEMNVVAILPDSALDAAMPPWDELSISADELRILPTKWQSAIQHWRGVYFIFDKSDGKGYVGSAYGPDNILGRWRNYIASGHGGNELLKKRNPKDFTFTILQRVSPDMLAEDVVGLESTWKKRLHTRHPFGLNDN